MSGVFINYRRSDDPSVVHAILAHLERSVPPQNIFLDVECIEPGADFAKIIDERLYLCSVLLAIIGPTWSMVSDAEGRRRLEGADDFVRRELVRALELKKFVIPVLVRDATPPASKDLPDDLKPLAALQAIRLEHQTFRQNVTTLVAQIERHLRERSKQSENAADVEMGAQGRGGSRWGGRFRTIVAFIVAGLFACVASEALSFAAFGSLSLDAPEGFWRSFWANLLMASVFVVAWSAAARVSGYRTLRTLIAPMIFFLVAWVVSGIYWENYSPIRVNNNAIDREVIEKLIIFSGWALYLPRLRRAFYFMLSIGIAIFGGAVQILVGSLSWPDGLELFIATLNSIAMNLPIFALIGYSVSQD